MVHNDIPIINCSLLPQSQIGQFLKKDCTNISNALYKQKIDKIKKEHLEILQRSYKICDGPNRNLLTVKNPILTKGIIEKFRENEVLDFICIKRLLQFLRSKTEMDDEGDYNELMHLSNCDCHSNQFKYLGIYGLLTSTSINPPPF